MGRENQGTRAGTSQSSEARQSRSARAVVEVCVMVGEKEAACWLVKHKPKDVGAVVVRLSNQLTGEADASICLFDYAVLNHQGIAALREFSTRMKELLRYWGSRLWPCERSVFVVFYNWEKFVGEMPWPQVLGWLEERKLEWLERLKNMSRQWHQEKANVPKELTEGSEVSATGRRVGRNAAAQDNQDVGVTAFGGLRWRLWAVSLQSQGRPTGVPEDFGVEQLLQQASSAALEYRRRRRRQSFLAGWYGLLSLVMLAGLVSGLWLLGKRFYEPRPVMPVEEDPTQYLPPLERLAWWTDRGRRLLRWEDWRQGAVLVVDWSSWLQAVHRYQQAITRLPRVEQPEAQVWHRALREVSEQLARVRARACVLGVEGAWEAGVEREVRVQPPFAFSLQWPHTNEGNSPPQLQPGNAFEAFHADVSTRLQHLRKFFPALDLQPLPGDIPFEVAEDLRQLAEQRYRAVLEPVRAEIRRQLLRHGEGRETLSAWRELVQRGWLGGAARRELHDWLTIVHTLQVWGGRTPTDPLDALNQFVLQEGVLLPLGRLWLEWPMAGERQNDGDADTRGSQKESSSQKPGRVRSITSPPSQLTITLLMSEGRETVLLYQRWETPPLQLSETRRQEFRLATHVSWPGECYLYRPGVGMRVQAQFRDEQGQAWQLTWSEREARSQVFGFSVLELTPRCHLPGQAPEEGEFLHGVRLRLSLPLPLPDLLP